VEGRWPADGGHHDSRDTPHAAITLHPSSIAEQPPRHSSLGIRHFPVGFSLIELMVVIAIMAIVLAMGAPAIYHVWHKESLRKATSDVAEVFSNARAHAILQGAMTEVVLHPREGRLDVPGGSNSHPSPPGAEVVTEPSPPPKPTGAGLSAQLPDNVIIEELDINMAGIEYNDVEVARVRFYPNGTSDEMKMILFDGRERVGLETEITTGLTTVVNNPLQAWTKR